MDEVDRRLKRYGYNLIATHSDPWWKVVIEPFRSIFMAVLGGAALVSLISHEVLDAAVIVCIMVINSVVFYSQHFATTRVLRSLKRHSVSASKVVRDGLQLSVSSIELVPGDIVLLSEGDKVPADARVVHVDDLQIDESALTGESVPIRKHASTLQRDHKIYEQDNMVFQGTYVLSGSARVLVVATAGRTEFGKIASLASTGRGPSPVQAKIDGLISLLVKAIGGVSLVVLGLALMRGMELAEAMRFVMSLAVAAVPEGLPIALTVVIVFGMRRMAKKKALVRSFKAIEDVGQITTIATDKTGTLTKNKLSVVEDWSLPRHDVGAIAARTVSAGSATDPLDIALSAKYKGLLREADQVYPFDIKLRMSGLYFAKDRMLYIKGSPEHMLANAALDDKQRHAAESAMHAMAAKGYRVIAFASQKLSGSKPPKDLSHALSGKLRLAGLIGFADELRPEAAHAVRAARAAGIQVCMITGDHYETAYNIAKQIGVVDHPRQVLSGGLPKQNSQLAAALEGKTVFSRILPEDKFRILQALKKRNITAMTGDGVNDVPALASAHVGIAMGSGSDIARDAGDIVLLNDNFSTIVTAIAEGRRIYDNVRRMLFYLLSTALGEVITMIGALLAGLPVPVTAIQILWINLVTDTTMVIPLGLEPEERGHMQRPPRRPTAPLLSGVLLSRMVLVATTMAIITLLAILYMRETGYSVAQIQTVAFMGLVAAQWMNMLNARSELESVVVRLRRANYGLLAGFLLAFGMQMAVMFTPLGGYFGVAEVPLWLLLAESGIMAAAVLAVVEIHKARVRSQIFR